jgi:hypothetical protein
VTPLQKGPLLRRYQAEVGSNRAFGGGSRRNWGLRFVEWSARLVDVITNALSAAVISVISDVVVLVVVI